MPFIFFSVPNKQNNQRRKKLMKLQTIDTTPLWGNAPSDCSITKAAQASDAQKFEMLERLLLSRLPRLVCLQDNQLAVLQSDLDAAKEGILEMAHTVNLLFPACRRRMPWLRTSAASKWPWRVLARNILKLCGNPFHPIAIGGKNVVYTLRHTLCGSHQRQ